MENTYRERRTISADKIIGICIRQEWYTMGTNEEYEQMLSTASGKENLMTDDIVEIATDILEHSDSERIMSSYGMDYDDVLKSVMFEIANAATVFVERV